MRIIKSSKVKQFTCIKCGSILEVKPTDIDYSDVGHPSGEWFVCPVCGKMNPVSGKLPEDWIPIIYKDEPI